MGFKKLKKELEKTRVGITPYNEDYHHEYIKVGRFHVSFSVYYTVHITHCLSATYEDPEEFGGYHEITGVEIYEILEENREEVVFTNEQYRELDNIILEKLRDENYEF